MSPPTNMLKHTWCLNMLENLVVFNCPSKHNEWRKVQDHITCKHSHGYKFGILVLAAYNTYLHIKTRREIIKKLGVNSKSIHSVEEGCNDSVMNLHVNKEPEPQYMEMETHTRSSNYPYSNRVNPFKPNLSLQRSVHQNNNSRS